MNLLFVFQFMKESILFFFEEIKPFFSLALRVENPKRMLVVS